MANFTSGECKRTLSRADTSQKEGFSIPFKNCENEIHEYSTGAEDSHCDNNEIGYIMRSCEGYRKEKKE